MCSEGAVEKLHVTLETTEFGVFGQVKGPIYVRLPEAKVIAALENT